MFLVGKQSGRFISPEISGFCKLYQVDRGLLKIANSFLSFYCKRCSHKLCVNFELPYLSSSEEDAFRCPKPQNGCFVFGVLYFTSQKFSDIGPGIALQKTIASETPSVFEIQNGNLPLMFTAHKEETGGVVL